MYCLDYGSIFAFSVNLEVKHCNIPCPNDCKMAQWSEWSKCPSKCRPGIQKRSRYIEQLNSAGGRQCPSLDSTQTETQTRLCHPECSLYMWKAYEWGMCDSMSLSCGDGIQKRVVNCVTVNINGDTTGITSEENCAGQVKPHDEQPCRLACVGECVMSDWSEWTECPRVGTSSKIRRKSVQPYYFYLELFLLSRRICTSVSIPLLIIFC